MAGLFPLAGLAQRGGGVSRREAFGLRRYFVIGVLLVAVAATVVVAVVRLSDRGAPRAEDYYDFLRRLPEAEIEDAGFLNLCWREPLGGKWSSQSLPDGRVRRGRRLEMPLGGEPEVLELYVHRESGEERVSLDNVPEADWRVNFGTKADFEFQYQADAHCWNATQYYLPVRRAILWVDAYQSEQQADPIQLALNANGEAFQQFELHPGRKLRLEWPLRVPDKTVNLGVLSAPGEEQASLGTLFVRAGLVYPSRVLVDLPAEGAPFEPEDLVLYYRPKRFDGLLPPSRFRSELPEEVERSSQWLRTYANVGQVSRPALRLLPGQKVRFSVEVSGEPEMSVAWSDGPMRPGPAGSEAKLELAVICEASPTRILWSASLGGPEWRLPKRWQEAVLFLRRWEGMAVELEWRYSLGEGRAESGLHLAWSPEVEDSFDFPFAYVTTLPLVSTDFPGRTRPSMILLAGDTLRADRLSCYGYRHPTTPHLDVLARHGTRYERAYSVASYTLPSFASLFTSRYPSEHTAFDRYRPLPRSVPTFTRILNEQGYQTAAFVDGLYLAPEFGMNQGFEYYDNQGGHLARVAPRALQWLDRRDRNRPFFLFLHFCDAHAPYHSPPEFRQRFDPNPDYDRIPRMKEEVPPQWIEGPDEWHRFEPEDIEHINALYDGALSWVDLNLYWFLDALSKRRLYVPSLVVLTSDHGEFLGKKGRFNHGRTLHDMLLHVPLIIKWPDNQRAGQLVSTPASLLDLAPTLLDVAGISRPQSWAGESLADAQAGQEPSGRVLFAQLPASQQTAVIDYPHKLVLDNQQSDPQVEVYHLERDPTESKDLASLDAQLTERLLGLLREHMAQTAPLVDTLAWKSELSPAVMEQLRALGYIGE